MRVWWRLVGALLLTIVWLADGLPLLAPSDADLTDGLALAQGGCTPRPAVQVQTAPQGQNTLQVSVTVTNGPAAPSNALHAIQFGAAQNALISVPGGPANSPGNFTVTLNNRPTQFPFTIQRNGSGTMTVPFSATDDCGPWQTFVGGGANLIQPTPTITPTPAPTVPASGSRLYVAAAAAHAIAVVNTTNLSLVATISYVTNPTGATAPDSMVIRADGRALYVSYRRPANQEVWVAAIDLATNQLVATIPISCCTGSVGKLSVVPNSPYLIVSGENSTNQFHILDTSTNIARRVAAIDHYITGAIANPSGTRIYVPTNTALFTVDPVTATVIATRPLQHGTASLTVNTAQNRLHAEPKHFILDLETLALLPPGETNSNATGDRPSAMLLTRDGSRLYIGNGVCTSSPGACPSSVEVFNTATGTVAGTVPSFVTGQLVEHPNSQRIYASSVMQSNGFSTGDIAKVTAIDPLTLATVDTPVHRNTVLGFTNDNLKVLVGLNAAYEIYDALTLTQLAHFDTIDNGRPLTPRLGVTDTAIQRLFLPMASQNGQDPSAGGVLVLGLGDGTTIQFVPIFSASSVLLLP